MNDGLTFDVAFEALLKSLDEAYKKLREQHADPGMLNDAYEKYVMASNEFRDVQKSIFRFKYFWNEVKDLPL